MSQNNEYFVKVAKLIAEQMNINEKEILSESSFENLGMDSLDQIEILMKTEELFNIEISDEETEKIYCVNDLISCVNKSLSK